jgi:mycothiol synthase
MYTREKRLQMMKMVRILLKARQKGARLLKLAHQNLPQLELMLPPEIGQVLVSDVPPGYRLRTFGQADEADMVRLLRQAGFSDFNIEYLRDALSICLPQGCFVVEHIETGVLVSTMMARHLASPKYPFGGRIDWLATDPGHRGRGLAAICASSATQRLMEAGYRNIWVTTDDHRLGALKIFIDIGFLPVMSTENEKRWKQVFHALNYGLPMSNCKS